MRENPWIRHLYRVFSESEDPGERAPAVVPIPETIRRIQKSPLRTDLSLVMDLFTLDMIIGGDKR